MRPCAHPSTPGTSGRMGARPAFGVTTTTQSSAFPRDGVLLSDSFGPSGSRIGIWRCIRPWGRRSVVGSPRQQRTIAVPHGETEEQSSPPLPDADRLRDDCRAFDSSSGSRDAAMAAELGQMPQIHHRPLGRRRGALRAEGFPFRVQMMQSKTVSNGELIAVSPDRGPTWKAEQRWFSQ